MYRDYKLTVAQIIKNFHASFVSATCLFMLCCRIPQVFNRPVCVEFQDERNYFKKRIKIRELREL